MKVADKTFVVLCVTLSVFMTLGNLVCGKFVMIHWPVWGDFEVSIGAFLYPVLLLLVDLVTESYGRKHASFALYVAVAVNMGLALILVAMDGVQASPMSRIDDVMFHQVFGVFSVAFLGSTIASLVSQTIDIRVFLAIRRITNGKYLWLRTWVSMAIALLIDSAIVVGFFVSYRLLPIERFYICDRSVASQS